MIHSENTAVGKYRIWTPAKYLKKIGWDVARIPDAFARMVIDRDYDGDDEVLKESAKTIGSWEELGEDSNIIIMQRPDQPDSIALAMAMREQFNCPLVFEVDDNIYDVAKTSTQYKYWAPGSPFFDAAEILMKNADALTVSTPALQEVYKHLNLNIHVLPNYQDFDDWKSLGSPGVHDKLTIGWQGSATHYDDIKIIRQVIKKILRNYKNVQFKMLGFKPDFFMNGEEPIERVIIETNFSPINEFPKRLNKMGIDIGVAPVTNRPFNLAKSNIKWQEYSMLKIPTIASRVGEYKEIEHEVTGLLADNNFDSWYYQIEKLIKSPEMRQTLGTNAYNYMKKNKNMSNNIYEWHQTYRDIINSYVPNKELQF